MSDDWTHDVDDADVVEVVSFGGDVVRRVERLLSDAGLQVVPWQSYLLARMYEDRMKERERQRNPEDNVIDEIDRLVDEQLTHRRDDYSEPYRERCPHGPHEWHGLPTAFCPGACADENAISVVVRQVVIDEAWDFENNTIGGVPIQELTEDDLRRLGVQPHGYLSCAWRYRGQLS